MRLSELLGVRPVPGAGVLVTLTQRCPLHCAHCSTDSTMAGGEPDAAALARFVDSFGAAPVPAAARAPGPAAQSLANAPVSAVPAPPEVLMLTGGEPLLRPRLVARLADSARAAGTRSALLTGAFFAREDRVPERIARAIRAVDHFSVSLDVFHEREVPRADVFRLLRTVLDAGIEASIHATGSAADDPYLGSLVAATRRAFGGRVPLLVTTVRPVGRAAAWSTARPVAADGSPLPCPMAAWPVVAPDGTVTACCNQHVVDRRPVPEHLRLGHIAVDEWAAIRARTLSSPVLRMVRAVGPGYLASRYPDQSTETEDGGATASPRPGYCASCRGLSAQPRVLEAARRLGSGAFGALLDQRSAQAQAEAGAVGLVRRWGSAAHAELVSAPGGDAA